MAVMGELRAPGAGSVVLPAGMINPSVPIRNIRMKFAVLIGLIQVGEVSNRDIVETVLNLVSGPATPPRNAPAGPGRRRRRRPPLTGHRPPPAGTAPYGPPDPRTAPAPSPPHTHGPSPAVGGPPRLPRLLWCLFSRS